MKFFFDIVKKKFINLIQTFCNLSKKYSSYFFYLFINGKKLKLFKAYLSDKDLLINSFNR